MVMLLTFGSGRWAIVLLTDTPGVLYWRFQSIRRPHGQVVSPASSTSRCLNSICISLWQTRIDVILEHKVFFLSLPFSSSVPHFLSSSLFLPHREKYLSRNKWTQSMTRMHKTNGLSKQPDHSLLTDKENKRGYCWQHKFHNPEWTKTPTSRKLVTKCLENKLSQSS